jgi:uncharacterized membrane protein
MQIYQILCGISILAAIFSVVVATPGIPMLGIALILLGIALLVYPK